MLFGIQRKSTDFSYDIINNNSLHYHSIMFSKGLEWKKVIFINCTIGQYL